MNWEPHSPPWLFGQYESISSCVGHLWNRTAEAFPWKSDCLIPCKCTLQKLYQFRLLFYLRTLQQIFLACFWSPAHSNSSDSYCGENRLCDRQKCWFYCFRDKRSTATVWVVWHRRSEDAFCIDFFEQKGQRNRRKGRRERDGISSGFPQLHFP